MDHVAPPNSAAGAETTRNQLNQKEEFEKKLDEGVTRRGRPAINRDDVQAC
jgi:hypothetical protein